MADSGGDTALRPFAAGVPPRPPADDLAELRAALLGPEQRQLRALQARLDDPATRTREVGRVLPDAIAMRATDPQLIGALAPLVEDAISASVRRNPRPLADALFPILGPAIRRAIAHALSTMLESMNRTLELSVSWRAVGWRVTALRTGKPFAEVVLLNTLLYRVEQVFLIHRDSGLLLQHVAAPFAATHDPDQISAMLTAIRDFAHDSFGVGGDEALEAMRVGELVVLVEQGPRAVVAAVVRGAAPAEFRSVLEGALESVHLQMGAELESFQGDAAGFDRARPILEGCLVVHYRSAPKRTHYGRWLIAAAALVAVAAWGALSYRAQQRWSAYLARLRAQPGIVVVDAERRGGAYYLTGLRDPLAPDPAALLRDSGIPAERVESRWERYQALDPTFVLARARTVLRPPPGVSLSLQGDVLAARGRAPSRWVAESARLAPLVPGVAAFETSAVAADDFDQVSEALGHTSLRFVRGQAALAQGQDIERQRLMTLLTGLQEYAAAAGTRVRVEIVGHADADGPPEVNLPLSRARADAVLAAVPRAALGALDFVAIGVGSGAPVAAGTTDADKQRNRCVSFRVTAAPPAAGTSQP